MHWSPGILITLEKDIGNVSVALVRGVLVLEERPLDYLIDLLVRSQRIHCASPKVRRAAFALQVDAHGAQVLEVGLEQVLDVQLVLISLAKRVQLDIKRCEVQRLLQLDEFKNALTEEHLVEDAPLNRQHFCQIWVFLCLLGNLGSRCWHHWHQSELLDKGIVSQEQLSKVGRDLKHVSCATCS